MSCIIVKNMNAWSNAMSLDTISETAVLALEQAIPVNLTKSDRNKILQILQHAMVDTVEQATESQREKVVMCCGPEADLAHKLEEEMILTKIALISNLNALR